MKKGFLFKKFALAVGLFSSIATLSSCSAFFGGDEYTITDIKQTIDDNTGDRLITITFSDASVQPLEIRIPSVTDGVGIENIDARVDNEKVIMTISYTDSNKEDTVISFPLKSGENGVGISDVLVSEDEEGNTTLQFLYTDGKSTQIFKIPKAQDGKDGVGIENIDQIPNGDGTYDIIITFTDPTLEPKILKISDGISISGAAYNEEASTDEQYAINIYFSNGDQTIIYLPRPQVVNWLTGFKEPINSEGKNNDFFVNLTNGNVYKKINGTWDFLFTMKGNDESEIIYYQVCFNLRDGESIKDFNEESKIIFNVKEGDCLPLNSIPLPFKDGYEFLGWFTSNTYNPNSSRFTDTTLVTRDFELYAQWQAL